MEEQAPAPALPAIRHLELKVALLIVLAAALVLSFVVYVLYARGVFDSTQRLVLVTDDSEGVYVGMDLTFAGFSMGRVQRIALGDDGKAHIDVAVPKQNARWLRASSVFTMERSLLGGTRIRAYTGQLDDAPLPDGAVLKVLRGDATEEIPRIVSSMKSLIENLQNMTAAESNLGASLENARTLSGRMAGKYGALAGALGSDANAKKVIAALDRANALLDSLGGVSAKLDQTLTKTDQRVFAKDGLMDETQKVVVQLDAALGDVRANLRKVDVVLADAQKIGAGAHLATEDLVSLRAEVEASLRKVGNLINEINRKWPFARDTDLKLP